MAGMAERARQRRRSGALTAVAVERMGAPHSTRHGGAGTSLERRCGAPHRAAHGELRARRRSVDADDGGGGKHDGVWLLLASVSSARAGWRGGGAQSENERAALRRWRRGARRGARQPSGEAERGREGGMANWEGQGEVSQAKALCSQAQARCRRVADTRQRPSDRCWPRSRSVQFLN
jgi:hypothetical protein